MMGLLMLLLLRDTPRFGSSCRPLGAGNSSRPVGLLRVVAKGVK